MCASKRETSCVCVSCPFLTPRARTAGVLMEKNQTLPLQHGDRVIIGKHHFFRVNVPGSVRSRLPLAVDGVRDDLIIKVPTHVA